MRLQVSPRTSLRKGTFLFICQCRTLQMQHSVFDFLRPTLVPELGSDVAAGTSCYEQLILVAVAAVRVVCIVALAENIIIKAVINRAAVKVKAQLYGLIVF